MFIVSNFSKICLQKNVVFAANNILRNSVIVVSKLFRVADYRKFYSFFF